jgi:uncharacterized protein (TIGR02246 family)
MTAEVEAVLADWAAAFGRGDGQAIGALYTQDALFIGGVGGVHFGPEGVAGYFSAHPGKADIRFSDIVTRPQGDAAVVVAMTGTITPSGGEGRDFRFLQLHVRTADGWRIAAHHGSHSL